MSLKSLSDYTIYSRYAHYLPEKKRRETWDEITERVFAMHARKYATALETSPEFKADFEFAKEMVRKKRILGSQRALQFGGKWIEDKNLRLFNCATTYVDRPRAFQEMMFTLLCGTGMGFSVQRQHVKKLPNIVAPSSRVKIYHIPDSIEGWSDAIGVLMASYFATEGEFAEYRGLTVKFDYSKIRPEGSLISGQFKAPGPKGLEKALENIRTLLSKRLVSESFAQGDFAGKMRPIDAYDSVMYASDAVLSGGVRRSATICIFSLDDNEMRDAKTGNWFIDNPQRARSNNSAALLKNQTTREQFAGLMKSTREFGEPGFIWLDNLDVVFNPCQPAWARVQIKRLEGYSTIGDINVGDEIACAEGWTKVTAKWSTGIKPVWRYKTESIGVFVGTENHRVMQYGVKVEVKDATHIDVWFNAADPANSKVITEAIVSREYLGDEEVFDLTVDNESHTYWTDGCIVSNCCEIGMIPQHEGESGIQVCNLVEINGRYCEDKERFLECCRAAGILGTMQAGYTDFKYLTPVSKIICDKEALLGCSITGIMDNPDVLLDAKLQQAGAKLILDQNIKTAKAIGVNPTARATCVKPAGSTSCVLKTASGIHPHHAKRYIRRVQANHNEFPLQLFKAHNPNSVETSVWSASGTDDVISFLCEVPNGAKLKNDVSAIEFLSQARLTQNNWVEYGTRPELCTDAKTRHNVSMTAVVRDDEWDKVGEYIFKHQKDFAGISLLPASGDLDYPQAPFATVLTPEEIVREYGDGSIIAAGLVVDGLAAFGGNLWKACDAALGRGGEVSDSIEPDEPKKPRRRDHKSEKAYTAAMTDYALKLNRFYTKMGEYRQNHIRADWVRRAKQFADRYFANDLRKATYCLKHVSLWHTWLTIKRTYKDIDWANVIEETETYVAADTLAAAACSGGSCELK